MSNNCPTHWQLTQPALVTAQVKLEATEAMIGSSFKTIRIALAAHLVNRCTRYLSSPPHKASSPTPAAASAAAFPADVVGKGSAVAGGRSGGGEASAAGSPSTAGGAKRRLDNSGGGGVESGAFLPERKTV